ncbi:MAG: hypothetical protein IH874_08625 [Candidatus Dadabacteria bacterium]|nr:hypothetical protein [Candidatus Dadabacteria bacterium]
MKETVFIFILGLFFLFIAIGCVTVQNTRENYVNAHTELDSRTKQAILNGKIFVGMTQEQVLASWGRPGEYGIGGINRSVGSLGVHELWIYYDYKHMPWFYLYFDNGTLTSWEKLDY